ncbi:hypothetical protein T4A_7990 [Trichinella pseudospiralis]|uniref:Uncharacterized protein n=1 Tax=Trichinella pseudospiralis TaxID=6337 RepID=A0A0V1DM37_TRIPS|nr:hypothetical protein T4A_7990 [Trichinella pseudospiralis]
MFQKEEHKAQINCDYPKYHTANKNLKKRMSIMAAPQ